MWAMRITAMIHFWNHCCKYNSDKLCLLGLFVFIDSQIHLLSSKTKIPMKISSELWLMWAMRISVVIHFWNHLCNYKPEALRASIFFVFWVFTNKTCFTQNTKKSMKFSSFCEWCGQYWIRTSDFHLVEVTLWTNWVNCPYLSLLKY